MWVYDVKVDGSAQSFHGEMARAGDDLFVAADPADGHIYRLDATSGDLRWKWPSQSGVSSDLFLVDRSVIAVTLGSELVALDAETGLEQWKTTPAEDPRVVPVTSTPLEWKGALLFARADGRLSLHDLATGSLQWSTDLGAPVSTDLLRLSQGVFVGLADGKVLRFDPDDGEILADTTLETIPTYRWVAAPQGGIVGLTGVTGPGRRLVGLDAETMEARWIRSAPEESQWTTAQPALDGDEILVGTSELAIYAVDAESGDIRWRAETDAVPRTISVEGSDMYVGSFDGTILAYRLGAISRAGEADRR